MCAFTFCWWACGELLEVKAPPEVVRKSETAAPAAPEEVVGRGKRKAEKARFLSWPATLRKVRAWLDPWMMPCRYYWSVLRSASAERAKSAA